MNKQFRRLHNGDVVEINLRYNDDCHNGHNTFAITGAIYGPEVQRGETSIRFRNKRYWMTCCGCIHDTIAAVFPEVQHLIKWHLCSDDGPMHYLPNACYWAGHCGCGGKNDPPNTEYLHSTIVYGALADDLDYKPESMTKAELTEWLTARLPRLLESFRAAVSDAEKLEF